MHKDTVEKKLQNIVRENKPKNIQINGKKHYVSRKIIDYAKDKQKEGGIIPLLPLIFGGIAAAGSVAGGTAGVVKAVHDKKAADAAQAEEHRHNVAMEKAAQGQGFIDDFVKATNLENTGKKALKEVLSGLSNAIKIETAKNGKGLYLNPY